MRIRQRFKDVYEGDAFMIEAWNETVKPEDHVWHLGDFCMGPDSQWVNVGKRLNGHKRIVPGNHDKVQHINTYKEAGFQKLCGANELHVAGLRLLCTHYPVHESSLFKRAGNIHGHTHQNQSPPPFVDANGKVKGWFNVSVERIEYRPINIEDLAKQFKEQLTKAGG